MHILKLICVTNGNLGLTPEALQKSLGSQESLPIARSANPSDLAVSKNGLFQIIHFADAEFDGHPGRTFLLIEMTNGIGRILARGHAQEIHRTMMAPEVVTFRGYSERIGHFNFVCQNKFVESSMAMELSPP